MLIPSFISVLSYPTNIYLFKFKKKEKKINHRNTGKRCEIRLKVNNKDARATLLNKEHISTTFSSVSMVDFEPVFLCLVYSAVNAGRVLEGTK